MRELSRTVARVGRDACPVTLHVMVKNAESVIGRLVDCVGPHVADVVAVLNDCEDDTRGVLESSCARHGLGLQVVSVTRESHPQLYRKDVPETYQVGEPYCGEVFPGPYTGDLLLSDWAAARNVGWRRNSRRWKLFLDADDVVDDPEVVPGLCQLLDAEGVEAAASRYHYHRTGRGDWRADAFRERLCRNLPWVNWEGKIHEVLTGHDPDHLAQVDGTLVVRDLRDSRGAGTRPPLRNLKVLYQHARASGWDITSRETVYLAAESQQAMPRLCLAMVEKYLGQPLVWPEEAGWACVIAGEVEEDAGHLTEASAWYERSLVHHPGEQAAYRLARSEFRLGRYAESLDAYERGRRNASRVQLLDGGTVQADATKIIAAACLRELGRLPEARALCAEAVARFPDNRALAELARSLEEGS